jgi:DNA (cytosine-5)-methyltransferase 1
MMEDIRLLYIDLFCGAGGTSTGVEKATHNGKKCAKVIACVNHDANAIASHAANHPEAVHYTEDIRTLELTPMVAHLKKMKAKYPDAYVVLWASLECTNFSKAKGGMPRDADSRTLAEHLFRYIEALNPDYIQIENVEEFMSWGDMDEHGHPISKDKGRCYLKWIQNVKSYGYDYYWRILNAADYGAYTSRKRFFGQFAKTGLPITFPVATHSKDGDTGGMFGEMKKWKPVRDVLDFSDEGESIFDRKKPLVEKTLERIYAGLIKFVAGMSQRDFAAFIVKYNSMNRSGGYSAPSIDEPCPTVACQNRLGVAQVHFLSKQFSGNPSDKNISVDGPAGTLTCIDHHALVEAEFLTAHYGNGFNSSLEKPSPTVTTKDRFEKVKACFLDMQYGNGTPSSIESPAPTATTNPKYQLVTAEQTTAKWHYLMNPQFASKGGSVNDPCFTLIARMDKMPPYLISTKEGVGIEVYETDSPMTQKIKEFMAMYSIIDIKMRMLKVSELKRIMGFPTDYVLVGSQSEQKKFIGNAVEVGMARVLCEALCDRLDEIERRVAV